MVKKKASQEAKVGRGRQEWKWFKASVGGVQRGRRRSSEKTD